MQQSSQANQAQNVEGFERFASVAGGLVLVGKGIRRGGLLGIIELAVGGMVLARGVSGQCELKRALNEAEQKQNQNESGERYSHMPLDSEVHSPDFQSDAVTMPDTTKMGNETRADQEPTNKPSSQGNKSTP